MMRVKRAAAEQLPPAEINTGTHSACVNTVVLVGTCSDVHRGFLYEDAVTQFTVQCPFDGACPAGESDKDNIVVRCSGMDAAFADGAILCVVGQLRMNPMLEPANSKFYNFPSVFVSPSTGSVTVLS